MRVPFLDLTEQFATVAEDVTQALNSVVSEQRFILGPEVESFEVDVARLVGAPYAVGCASGTDALLLPLQALDAPREAEVVVPAFTFFATAGAVWNAGLTPAFCDVRPDTFNVDADTIAAALSDQTCAVMPVHLFGQMAPMEGISALARERGVFVLEDAAQAIGARSGELRAGAAGDAAGFSFFPTKNLGGFGDGGMITTSDPNLAERLERRRRHGQVGRYRHAEVGMNSRLDAIQAAVLRAKLPHLQRWTEGRRSNAALYDEILREVPQVRTPISSDGTLHVYNQYTIRVPDRDDLRRFLDERGVGSAVYYPVPLHLQECFRPLGYAPGDFPVSEQLAQDVLSLPIYPELGPGRVRRVAAAVKEFYVRRGRNPAGASG